MSIQARIALLENMLNAMTAKAPLKEKAAVVAKIRALENQL